MFIKLSGYRVNITQICYYKRYYIKTRIYFNGVYKNNLHWIEIDETEEEIDEMIFKC